MGGKGRKKEGYSLRRALGMTGPVRRSQVQALYRQAMIHFDCRGYLQAENCRGILRFDAERLVLDMGTAQLRITGLGLMVDTYHQQLITIHGRIFSVETLEPGQETGRLRQSEGKVDGA